MAVVKSQKNSSHSTTEDNSNDPSSISSLAEKLRDRLNAWDTDHMARVIHQGTFGYSSPTPNPPKKPK